MLGIGDGITRGIEGVQASVSELLFEPVVRLGVTGLSRAGKTVFITSLIANLLNRGRMVQLQAQQRGRIEAVYLQPQPDDTVARFDYETHLASLQGEPGQWPQSTRSVSELRLSFRLRPDGMLASWRGPKILHLDIVDYPGEWLLDLALMDKSYSQWANDSLMRMERRPQSREFMARARAEDGSLAFDEQVAQRLSQSFSHYLQEARAAGWSDCSPGRFLLPGDLAGSPVLTFAPLPMPAATPKGCLWLEMQRRYEAYKTHVVTPFFRDHFAKIDRQIVLMDVLGAIHQGPQAVEDLRQVMAEVLSAFRLGRSSWLSSILGGHRVDKILFAATKADYLHHEQHPQLTAITEGLVAGARQRAAFSGAEVGALSMAAWRSTTEEHLTQDGQDLAAVHGRLAASGKQAVMYAGRLPDDPAQILAAARGGAEAWLEHEFALMDFAPMRFSAKPGDGPAHIRLDRAVEFLIGDRL